MVILITSPSFIKMIITWWDAATALLPVASCVNGETYVGLYGQDSFVFVTPLGTEFCKSEFYSQEAQFCFCFCETVRAFLIVGGSKVDFIRPRGTKLGPFSKMQNRQVLWCTRLQQQISNSNSSILVRGFVVPLQIHSYFPACIRKRLIEGQNSTIQKQLFEGQKSHDLTAPVPESAAQKVIAFKSGTAAMDRVKGMFVHDPTAVQRKKRWTKWRACSSVIQMLAPV